MVYFFDLQKATSDERMAKTGFYRECGSGFRACRGARRGTAGKAVRGRAAYAVASICEEMCEEN